MLHSWQLCLLVAVGLVSSSNADTPANCTYEDIKGTWVFSIGSGNHDRTIDCSNFTGPAKNTVTISLRYPDIAIDIDENKITGFWTIIYNQGFEVNIAGRKYFAFSKYDPSTKKSFCDKTMPGSTHNVLESDWACYFGVKTSSTVAPKPGNNYHEDSSLRFSPKVNSMGLVSAINKVQNAWTATYYPEFDRLTPEELVMMAGGKASRISRPKAAAITEEQRRIMASLPESFDWRNISGENFVSPVRNQGSCGSCYAFASMAMNEARIKVLTDNKYSPVFSPQDIVECTPYAQGCQGGFPYLIGGKYAEDYGLVEETCNPYKGVDGKCHTDPSCVRHYSTNYAYVGGYYGACNEAAMMQAIYKRGPVAVGFEVYGDFMAYRSGVYHHVFNETRLGFNPFELTNHAVLAVGWGIDKTSGLKYWIVKNSWGENWGMNGYFKIERGNDECGIESMAVEATPIIDFEY